MGKVTLTNDFHNTSVVVIPKKGGVLTRRQVLRARKALCGKEGCTCGDTCGARPLQTSAYNYQDYAAYIKDGSDMDW